MPRLQDLNIKIFADGADLNGMIELAKNPLVKGFTTNPSICRKAGVTDYEKFALELVGLTDKPISFEVFADDFPSMIAQGFEIASWGNNVVVKVPVTNTSGQFAGPAITTLQSHGVKINITAVFTVAQVKEIAEVLDLDVPVIVSIFAGRIADTGVDPVKVMGASVNWLDKQPKAEVLWASPREVLNVYQAEAAGCHIITCAPDMIAKLIAFADKDLTEFSRETVKQFHDDAVGADYRIKT